VTAVNSTNEFIIIYSNGRNFKQQTAFVTCALTSDE